MTFTREQILASLDVAILKPDAPVVDICDVAQLVGVKGFASICVASGNVPIAKRYTEKVCAVVGFPHGNVSCDVKRQEAIDAIGHGAVEIDVVLNYGRYLSGDIMPLTQEIRALTMLCHSRGVLLKAILETCYLRTDQIAELTKLCVGFDVDFVKTSTGFGPGNATPAAVQTMLDTIRAIGGRTQVKASGGLKTNADANLYLGLGCTRLGVGYKNYEGLLPC